MNIQKKNILCKKGSADFNEDMATITPHGAWIMDGATGLNGKNLVSDKTDAFWYVNWWNEYLKKHISTDKTPAEIIKRGIIEIKKTYKEITKDFNVTSLDLPSSGIILLKWKDDIIEYCSLGDCTLYIKDGFNSSIITDDAIPKLDNIVYEKMDYLINEKNIPNTEAKEEVMDIIKKNRLLKNTSKGYWILGFDENATKNALKGRIKVKDDVEIMMVSDGFSALYDKYNYIDIHRLFSRVKNNEINELYNTLRDIENEDLNMIKYPRFKISDDASCIYLNLSS
ncbi:MAG: hypothetical protein FH753_05815 [Firmicutes bacterium]|nr:hypothetical protein [Bacillota bacterium]